MWNRTGKWGLALFGICLVLVIVGAQVSTPAQRHAMIVQAGSLVEARRVVRSVGGEITHELKIIRAVRIADRLPGRGTEGDQGGLPDF